MVASVLVLGGSVAPILHWGCSLRLRYVLRTRRGGRKQPERVTSRQDPVPRGGEQSHSLAPTLSIIRGSPSQCSELLTQIS